MNKAEFESMLEKYADVIIRVGLNLQKGQRLTISATVEENGFVRKLVESAYKAGAVYVDVWIFDEMLDRIRFLHAAPETITEFPDWRLARFEEYRSRGDAHLSIASEDPDIFSGIDSDLIAKNRKATSEKFDPVYRKYQNTFNWCVVSTSTTAWARKVFPDVPQEEAQTKLWEAILQSCRIDQPDPVKAWEVHIRNLTKYKEYLNAKRYSALKYSAPGTYLTIGLPEKHYWEAGQAVTKKGLVFSPNLPTEEVFTLPHKDKVDGIVQSTRPLNYFGVMIEDFSMTFENGRIMKVTAKKGEPDLKKLIESDENACRLGEVSLVPNNSPISQRGHLFYNILFDENAACHLAIGDAYRDSIQGGAEMSEEEFQANGGNKSIVHVDFMIGSPQMDIDGITKDGAREPVMRQGEWAFEA